MSDKPKTVHIDVSDVFHENYAAMKSMELFYDDFMKPIIKQLKVCFDEFNKLSKISNKKGRLYADILSECMTDCTDEARKLDLIKDDEYLMPPEGDSEEFKVVHKSDLKQDKKAVMQGTEKIEISKELQDKILDAIGADKDDVQSVELIKKPINEVDCDICNDDKKEGSLH